MKYLNIKIEEFYKESRYNKIYLWTKTYILLWLHLPRVFGVVITTSVLFDWWMLGCSMEWIRELNIYILGGWYKYTQPHLSLHSRHLNITFSILHFSISHFSNYLYSNTDNSLKKLRDTCTCLFHILLILYLPICKSRSTS